MLSFPPKMSVMFNQDGTVKRSRYKVFYGGRSSGKSYGAANLLNLDNWNNHGLTNLCARQFQQNTGISLKPNILNLSRAFDDGKTSWMRERNNNLETTSGGLYLFKGVERNENNIKGIDNVRRAIVDEASDMKQSAFDVLVPTVIRNDGGEIWLMFNPDNQNDPVIREFFDVPIGCDYPIPKDRDDTIYCNINYMDNPFNNHAVYDVAERMRANDLPKYNHIYLGHFNKLSESQVLYGKWAIDRFEAPAGAVFYHGLDFGFSSSDPNAWVRCYITENTLFIDYAVFCRADGYETLTSAMELQPWKTWKTWKTYCDSSRPEGVIYLRQKNINAWSCGGKTTVESGIEYLRSFDKIVVHERCAELIEEFQNYKYKLDPKTGDVTPVIIDKYNHGIDSLRYALIGLTKKGVVNT